MSKPELHFAHANGIPSACYRKMLGALDASFAVKAVPVLGTDPKYPVDNNWHSLAEQVADSIRERCNGPVIGVGHSLGGLTTFMAAHRYPELFRAVVIMDPPVINGLGALSFGLMKAIGQVDRVTPAGKSQGRREVWPSREVAHELLGKKRLFRSFDPECFDDYIRFGLSDCEEGVCLTIPAAVEVDILRTLSGLGLCTPRVMALDESLRFIPHPLVILHHIDGETVSPMLADDARLGTMAQMLAHIHSVPIAGLPSLPARLDPIPELFDYLPEDREFDGLRARLSDIKSAPYDGPMALLHGDFWPGNLLWKGDQLVGVLDWEDAAYGDPLSDLACAVLELSYVAGPEGAQRFLTAYKALRPFDLHRFALWQLYVAAAAHHFMGGWGLDPNREAHMRATALSTIREASALVI
mgnify:CR=1 FL=1